VEEAGADVESKGKNGKTALDLARQGTAKGSWRALERKAVAARLESSESEKAALEREERGPRGIMLHRSKAKANDHR